MAKRRAVGLFLVALSTLIYGIRLCQAGYLDMTTLIKKGKELCFTEPIGKEMYTHITIHLHEVIGGDGLGVVIREEGADSPIYEEANLIKQVSVSFTTIHGISVVCCLTANSGDAYVGISLKSGADARDYSIIAKSTHLDPVDAHLQNALDEFSAFHKAQITGSRSIDRTSKKAAQTYSLLTKFAIANSVFVIISTLCFVFYFRSFFISKKVM
ncbi:hypothetical protein BgAZ_105420 [Babesia gibsoni]|uniref:GOLD domain-containing protein n=1 Tax=Babesia gibsoni TaxID=33632 RepID=A0AAD8PFU1_BABGI|nr:hypothetical protein BgAZ_105420 [Babesia gibsoni]